MRRLAAAALASLLLGGCLLAYDYGDYQSADTSSSSTGGTCSPDTGAPKACNDCLDQQCGMQQQACTTGDLSSACKNWILCTLECCDPACFRECDAKFTANDARAGVYACMCAKCNTAGECAGVAQPTCD